MSRKRTAMTPGQKASIYAARDMLSAVATAGKRAGKRLKKAETRYGRGSAEYLAEKAGYDETQRLVDSLHPTLLNRLRWLEKPFKEETW